MNIRYVLVCLLALSLLRNSAVAGNLEEKIFDSFTSNFCFYAQQDIFSFKRPVMGNAFGKANKAIDSFLSNCFGKRIRSFPEFNNELQKIQAACEESGTGFIQHPASMSGAHSDSNRELTISINLCKQAVKSSQAVANIAFQTSKGACEPSQPKRAVPVAR